MTQGSPSAYLLWALLAVTFQLFFILHLWAYDRFQCIRWHSGRQPGAFKRVMTYSYVTELPLLMIFGVAMSVIKYKEGFVVVPGSDRIIPRPFDSWTETSKTWVIPLYFVLSVAWALEIVTHLEELTFWLFLLHQGPSQRNWFRSWEFRVWYLGSMTALSGIPLTALVKRKDADCLAWIFLVGSSAGTVITISSFYVLAKFPNFIRRTKDEGAEPDIVVRLTTFYQLNLTRVAFRVCFNFPLLIVGIDGVQGQHQLILDPFWSDLFFMLGSLGCFASSVITLLIFFPRSITQEAGYTARTPSLPRDKTPVASLPDYPDYHGHHALPPKSPVASLSPYPQPPLNSFRFPDSRRHSQRQASVEPQALELERHPSPSPSQYAVHRLSHRRYLSEGEATPEYESDPEPLSPKLAVTGALRVPSTRPTKRSNATVSVREVESGPHLAHMLLSPAPRSPRERSQQAHSRQHLHSPQREVYRLEDGTIVPQNAIHSYVMNFTSPLDLFDGPTSPHHGPRAV